MRTVKIDSTESPKCLFSRKAHVNENTSIQIYSNISKILQPKKEKFPIKKSDIFPISSQNLDCGYSLEPPRRGGSNVYPQSVFILAKSEKIMCTPVNPSFTIRNLFKPFCII